jgi:hypothetical protein
MTTTSTTSGVTHVDPVVRGLGGRDQVLQFSVNALAELEDRSARNIGQLLAQIRLNTKAPSFSACRWLVWAGLLHRDEQFLTIGVPAVTPAQIGEQLDAWLKAGHAIGDLGAAIAAGLERSGLFGERPAPGNAPPEAAPASPTSGSPTGSTP